jgi:2-polyprenyl-6-hydroxyphenyl methylase/3-demethylubiquinone-9 3-methyltransferase
MTAPHAVPCKCCGADTTVFGSADASRSCNDRHGTPTFPASGTLVTYRRCGSCGFVFTTDFDALSDADLGLAIYNDAYGLTDPDFIAVRPRYQADEVTRHLGHRRTTLRCLDYGGGAGAFAEMMREAGFDYRNHDPYFSDDRAPDERFDLVTAFEVIEHSRDPVATFRDACDHVSPGGLLLFSTQLLSRGAEMDWWYIAPRNGHVSIHTEASLMACAQRVGMRIVFLADGLHAMYRAGDRNAVPPLVADLVRRLSWNIMQRASALGLGHTLRTAALVLRSGGGLRSAANPRHLGRAMAVSLAVPLAGES